MQCSPGLLLRRSNKVAFAQQNYGELLGNSTTETISEDGCFLTAFCNLLQRWGENVDPPTLNNFFKANGSFIGADDLRWSSITVYDGNIQVHDIGANSVPTSNDAIVQFNYNSVHTGQPISHFCLVDHMEGNQVFIVDSWDGSVKGPAAYESVYHLPVAWATYVKNSPAPATPAYTVTESYDGGKVIQAKIAANKYDLTYRSFADVAAHITQSFNVGDKVPVYTKVHHVDGYDYYMTVNDPGGYNVADWQDYVAPPPTPVVPPQGAINLPQTEKYVVLTTVKAYPTSNSAANDINARGIVNAGTYFVYNKANGMVNVTSESGKPGSWINPAENTTTPPAPLPTIASEPTSTPPVQTPPVDPTVPTSISNPNGWKTTQSAYYIDRHPERFTSINAVTIDVYDLDGKHDPIQLPPNTRVSLIATFEKDGILYGRPEACFIESSKYFGDWYGIPMRVLKSDQIYNRATAAVERLGLNSAKFADRLYYEGVKIKQFLDGIKSKRRKP